MVFLKQFFADWSNKVAGPKSRWVTLVIWVLIVAVLSISWPAVNEEEAGSSGLLPENMMSVEASKIAKEQFSNDAGSPLLMVWYREGGLKQADYETIQKIYQKLQQDPLAEQSFIPPFSNIPIKAIAKSASEDGAALTTPLFFDKKASVDSLQGSLDELQHSIEKQVEGNPFEGEITAKGLHIRFTGPVGIQTDASELFSQADVTLLIATTLLVLVLLIVLYRSPLLAIVPLIGVGFAYGVISPLLGFMASRGWITVDAQTISIMTVLLFGAGTDYCLFLVSRYRDELQQEADKYKALRLAINGSGGAIMMSALTVVLGLLTLSLALYASYDRFAVPFSLAIFIIGIAALTLLPALLSLLGRVAFFPFIPRTEKMAQELEEKKGKPVRHPKSRSRFSKAVGKWVTEKPWRIIIGCVIVLGGLASFVPKMEYTYGLLDSFPETMPSREGFAIISDHYPPGELAPIQVIVDTEGKERSLQEDLTSLPIVESVAAPKSGEENSDLKELEVTLESNPYSTEAVQSIPDIKDAVVQGLSETGVDSAEENVWIGGETATLYDTEKVTSRDQNVIIPVVLIVIALLLLFYLRSVVAMIYLLATVLLSYFAALGLGWLLIHYGFGTTAMQGLIPLYSFVFLVALGEDYNIDRKSVV